MRSTYIDRSSEDEDYDVDPDNSVSSEDVELEDELGEVNLVDELEDAEDLVMRSL